MKVFKEDLRWKPNGMDEFMGYFGYSRLMDSNLWYANDYVQRHFDDPNQLKLDFGV
jgi:hypothetical protein